VVYNNHTQKCQKYSRKVFICYKGPILFYKNWQEKNSEKSITMIE